MGQTVLDSYVQEHIPHAIDLALKINTPEHKKFIWTVGSFLVDYYKRHAAPEQLEKMDEAIRLGYFRWHGLAVTSHTELQSPEVLAYNLSVSRRLDRAYGVHTIAAKMTDVPGHTIALVRPLSEAGIRYLHIGVNPSSRVPRVPEVFRWRRDGHEVIVHYSAQYGQAISIPGFDEALEFAHTGGWAEADFSKPGLETAENLRHTCYAFALERLTQTGDTVIATVRGDGEAAEEYGSPRRAQLIYTFEQDAVRCRLQWFEKDANKIPEALWLHFGLDVENPNRWKCRSSAS